MLRVSVGKAVFPVARIPADALPFTTAAWQCNLLPQRAIFSAIVPDLTEAAQFKVQLPVCTSNAGTSKDSLRENFARALRQQRPDWPVSLHQVTQTLQYVEEAVDPVIEVRGPCGYCPAWNKAAGFLLEGGARVWPLHVLAAGAAGLYDLPT